MGQVYLFIYLFIYIRLTNIKHVLCLYLNISVSVEKLSADNCPTEFDVLKKNLSTSKCSSVHNFKNHIKLFSTFLDESRERQM